MMMLDRRDESNQSQITRRETRGRHETARFVQRSPCRALPFSESADAHERRQSSWLGVAASSGESSYRYSYNTGPRKHKGRESITDQHRRAPTSEHLKKPDRRGVAQKYNHQELLQQPSHPQTENPEPITQTSFRFFRTTEKR